METNAYTIATNTGTPAPNARCSHTSPCGSKNSCSYPDTTDAVHTSQLQAPVVHAAPNAHAARTRASSSTLNRNESDPTLARLAAVGTNTHQGATTLHPSVCDSQDTTAPAIAALAAPTLGFKRRRYVLTCSSESGGKLAMVLSSVSTTVFPLVSLDPSPVSKRRLTSDMLTFVPLVSSALGASSSPPRDSSVFSGISVDVTPSTLRACPRCRLLRRFLATCGLSSVVEAATATTIPMPCDACRLGSPIVPRLGSSPWLCRMPPVKSASGSYQGCAVTSVLGTLSSDPQLEDISNRRNR